MTMATLLKNLEKVKTCILSFSKKRDEIHLNQLREAAKHIYADIESSNLPEQIGILVNIALTLTKLQELDDSKLDSLVEVIDKTIYSTMEFSVEEATDILSDGGWDMGEIGLRALVAIYTTRGGKNEDGEAKR